MTVAAPGDAMSRTAPATLPPSRRNGIRFVLAALLAIQAFAIIGAMRHTSVTFDELVFLATGPRGWHTGEFDLVTDHPPLAQYVYGLPGFLTRPNYPDETGATAETKALMGYRYGYAQQFLFHSGNDPERLTFLGRLPAAGFAVLLTLAVFLVARRLHGDGVALLAASLVAFLPDVLAHGGLAYNDVPTALLIFLSVYAMDAALRRPTLRSGAVAGFVVALAIGMKMSALMLAPIALLLLAAETGRQRLKGEWLRACLLSIGAALLAAYATTVAIYGGDVLLAELRYAAISKIGHATHGQAAAALLLGRSSHDGFWYFYPVALLLKTSAGVHLLALLAVLGFTYSRPSSRDLLGSPLRAPLIALAVIAIVLLTARLNIGFRHALPAMPFLCVIIAAGAIRFWHARPRFRLVVPAAAVWAALFSLSWYPHYLPFVSEYGPGRDLGHTVYIDSNLDWGQGLIELRRYMHANGIDRVYLSYFGSAHPAGYGIDHVPLASFFPLPAQPQPPDAAAPKHLVISATNLHGGYLAGDPFAMFRDVEPNAVLGHTMYVFELPETDQ